MVSLCRWGQHWAQIYAYICLLNAGVKDGHHHAWLQFSSYVVEAGLNPWFSSLSTGIMGMGHNAKLLLTQIISEAFTMANKMIQDLFQTSYSLSVSLPLATWSLWPFCKCWDASPSSAPSCAQLFPQFSLFGLCLETAPAGEAFFDFLLSAALLVLLIPFDSLHYFYTTR